MKEWKGAFSPRMAENTKDPGGIGVLRPFPGPRKNKDQKFKRGVPNPRIRLKDGLIAILLNNMPLPEERPLPEIKFKELKSDKS